MPTSRRSWLKGIPLAAGLRASAAPAAVSSKTLEQRLLDAFEKLYIADTHEHLYSEKDRLAMPVDFFTLVEQSYVMADLVSAGLPPESSRLIRNPQATDSERWKAFEPYWKIVRFTGYAQALQLAIKDLYGVAEISSAALRTINEAIRSQNKPGLYRRLLRERARIRFYVEDDSCGGCIRTAAADDSLQMFVLARRFDAFITPSAPADIAALESTSGTSVTTLAGLKEATEKSFAQNLREGMKAVKIALAYYRELYFQEIGEPEAARDFEALMRQERRQPEGFRRSFERPFRRLEDYMFHHLMRLAETHRLPVQIHTGLFAGNSGLLTNAKPTHLINTFQLYPKINFDIFHISYPYQEELGVLAKSFPNVFADFCWAFVVSPPAARRTLHELLEIAPTNKILGFGGDYKHAELVYAHAKMARRGVARVLAEKVEARFCSEEQSYAIGKMLLFDNAARLFAWNGPGA